MFEAANSVDRRYVSFLHVAPATRGASGPVAVATAAHDVLLAALPAQKAMIEERFTLALAEERDGPGKDAGLAAGHAAAAAALQAGGLDPAASLAPFWPAGKAGQWLATTATVLDPHYAAMKPWFMATATAFRPGPPVALDSPRWLKDVDEVRRIGGKASPERSAADTVLAKFWVAADPTPALRAVAAQLGRSLVKNARFYAMYSFATDDMGIAVVEAKLHYAFWRPITAIRAGGGNPAIVADPLWEPLLKTPLHPEYPCGHCINAAVTAAIIDADGAPKSGLPFTSTKMPGVTVTVPTTADYVRQDSFSRIAGGFTSARPTRRARRWVAGLPPTRWRSSRRRSSRSRRCRGSASPANRRRDRRRAPRPPPTTASGRRPAARDNRPASACAPWPAQCRPA